MWTFKLEHVLKFILLFLGIYALFMFLLMVYISQYGFPTEGQNLLTKLVSLLAFFPVNPLANEGGLPMLVFVINGCTWGFVFYSLICGIKKVRSIV